MFVRGDLAMPLPGRDICFEAKLSGAAINR